MGNSKSTLNTNGAPDGQISLQYNRHVGSPTYWGGWPIYIGQYSNSLISNSLQNELKTQCKLLINDKNKLNYRSDDLLNKDTLNNVEIQDIIEPHNLCTLTTTNTPKQNKQNTSGIPYALGYGNNPMPTEDINAWIPTVFKLNNKTKQFEIISDIVDLPRNNINKSLYNTIEKIFNKLVPNIQNILKKYPFRGESDNKNLEPHVDDYVHFDHDNTFDNIREYNVIIKLTDYQFVNQNNSSYGGGNFHSEGFDKEQICAVALYYFDVSENIIGGGLSFKDPTYKWRISSNETSVEIKDNTTVCFVNKEPYLHAVNSMNINGDMKGNVLYENKNGKQVYGTRKLLGFFITKNGDNSTKNVIVNFQWKVRLVVDNMVRKMNCGFKVNNDVFDMIKLFVCGGVEYMKDI
eukprot:279768_1